MSLSFTAAELRFRDEVRRALEPWRDLEGFFFQNRNWPRVRVFFRELGARGWLSLAWPRELGGQGLSLRYEYLLWDECARARVARPPLSAGIVARTLIRHGTPAQQARWLPGIRSGELHFSLGYSEPGAGSDLAGLRTRAERRADHYRVRGEKCWTSYAGSSDYLWLLCRTGPPESRSRGLSLLIVDLRAPGVTVSPLPTLDDECLFEVRLDDVEVPVEHRVGPENGAWRMMAAALADERHVQFPPGRLRRDLEEVAGWFRARGRADDARVRSALAALAAEVEAAEALALRVLAEMEAGSDAAVSAAANKVFHTELCQRIARTAVELGGEPALLGGGPLEILYRQSIWETIGGGTSEIMRSVVARSLGLPPEGRH